MAKGAARPRADDVELLTCAQVSRMLGVSPNTVTRWAREGRLPCQMTLGGHHRFDKETVEQIRQGLHRSGERKTTEDVKRGRA